MSLKSAAQPLVVVVPHRLGRQAARDRLESGLTRIRSEVAAYAASDDRCPHSTHRHLSPAEIAADTVPGLSGRPSVQCRARGSGLARQIKGQSGIARENGLGVLTEVPDPIWSVASEGPDYVVTVIGPVPFFWERR